MIQYSASIWLFKFISSLKNLYGRFWATHDGFYEYYLKLDGYYFCTKQKSIIAVIRVRNKRTTDLIPIQEIVNDKEYLKELHPVDVCILGIIANNERNGIIDNRSIGWRKMFRSKGYPCFIKADPILEVTKKYLNENNEEITVLRSKYLNKKIEISTIDLCKNPAFLYALDCYQAISVGYDASEILVRQNINYYSSEK